MSALSWAGLTWGSVNGAAIGFAVALAAQGRVNSACALLTVSSAAAMYIGYKLGAKR